jgi:hypothetical protein
MALSPVSATPMAPADISSTVPFTVGVDTSVALPGTFFRSVWKFTSPEEMCQATLRAFVDGSSEVSSIVMRLSGRTCTTVPSKKVISAAAPGPVRTRSLLRSTMLRSAVTHSKVPTVFTLTLPSIEVKRAVVTVGVGASTCGGGTGAFIT